MMIGVVLGTTNTIDEDLIPEFNDCLPAEWGIAVDEGKLAILAANTAREAAKLARQNAIEAKAESSEASELLKKTAQEIHQASSDITKLSIITDNFAKKVAATAYPDQAAAATTNPDPNQAENPEADKGGILKHIEEAVGKLNFKKYLDMVQRIVDFVCKYKRWIKMLLRRKYKRYLRKSMHRSFFQRRSSRSLSLMSSQNYWDDMTGKYSGIVNALHQPWSKVKEFGKWIVDKIKDKVHGAIEWGDKFLESPVIKKVRFSLECIATNKDVFFKFIKTLVGIAKRITDIVFGGPAGATKVFLDMVCNLGKFREAFAMLRDAKGETIPLVKWKKFGMTIGKFLYALGG